ncbi:AAA family ATPase [Candidatus Woesearchaeota archaeon]|nr:AAA family ATPase [Candidatus Woesearchaeota archaeon]
MIIGLTGKNAAGKGELAKHMQSKGFVYFSLSDALREEADNRKLDHFRDTLISLGNELRKKFGNGILAKKINEKIKNHQKIFPQEKFFVIDSIRNPGEVEELRKNEGFLLVGVVTDQKIRFQRLLKRGRIGDATTFEEFKKQEDKENNNEESGQQLDKCLQLADKDISSNGTIEEANKEFDEWMGGLN